MGSDRSRADNGAIVVADLIGRMVSSDLAGVSGAKFSHLRSVLANRRILVVQALVRPRFVACFIARGVWRNANPR